MKYYIITIIRSYEKVGYSVCGIDSKDAEDKLRNYLSKGMNPEYRIEDILEVIPNEINLVSYNYFGE